MQQKNCSNDSDHILLQVNCRACTKSIVDNCRHIKSLCCHSRKTRTRMKSISPISTIQMKTHPHEVDIYHILARLLKQFLSQVHVVHLNHLQSWDSWRCELSIFYPTSIDDLKFSMPDDTVGSWYMLYMRIFSNFNIACFHYGTASMLYWLKHCDQTCGETNGVTTQKV